MMTLQRYAQRLGRGDEAGGAELISQLSRGVGINIQNPPVEIQRYAGSGYGGIQKSIVARYIPPGENRALGLLRQDSHHLLKRNGIFPFLWVISAYFQSFDG